MGASPSSAGGARKHGSFSTYPLPCSIRHLALMTQAAFGQRRKMLRQSLKALPDMRTRPVDVTALLELAGIDPTWRAEEVDVAGFVRLTCAWLDLDAPRS